MAAAFTVTGENEVQSGKSDMVKGTELIQGGLECQLPPLISPLLLLPAVTWTEEKLVQSRLSMNQVSGWAQPRARQDCPRAEVQGFLARCRGLTHL